jgi:hypothetical protein
MLRPFLVCFSRQISSYCSGVIRSMRCMVRTMWPSESNSRSATHRTRNCLLIFRVMGSQITTLPRCSENISREVISFRRIESTSISVFASICSEVPTRAINSSVCMSSRLHNVSEMWIFLCDPVSGSHSKQYTPTYCVILYFSVKTRM